MDIPPAVNVCGLMKVMKSVRSVNIDGKTSEKLSLKREMAGMVLFSQVVMVVISGMIDGKE